jgi:hypothetical protein
MPIPGKLLTTAMAVMPHRDAERALQAALSLDIPFWPQLPLLSYREDMYVQASENFPGILLDMDRRRLGFSLDKFLEDFEAAQARFDDPSFFDISPAYSTVYGRFLEFELADRPAIHGQMEGPVSFGFNVLDQNERPILFDDTIRPLLFEFLAKRVNAQLARLRARNENAFMFVDEPGLQFLFSALSGYSDQAARPDLERFFASIERPRGIHLCGNPDWEFLLNLDLDILSMDAHTNGEIVARYGKSIRAFLERGGVLAWGLVPTGQQAHADEDGEAWIARLDAIWEVLLSAGVDRERLLAQSLLSPATCCLVNADGAATVDAAFASVVRVSAILRERHRLDA